MARNGTVTVKALKRLIRNSERAVKIQKKIERLERKRDLLMPSNMNTKAEMGMIISRGCSGRRKKKISRWHRLVMKHGIKGAAARYSK